MPRVAQPVMRRSRMAKTSYMAIAMTLMRSQRKTAAARTPLGGPPSSVVLPPERLVFTVSDQPDEDAYELVTVVLTDLGDGRTRMLFQQHGRMTAEEYDRAGKGWSGFFDRIAERLAAGA